jgi:CRP-like cAMP-binding protein
MAGMQLMDFPAKRAQGEQARNTPFSTNDLGTFLMEECQFTLKDYSTEEIISRQGDEDDRTYFVQSGWARLYVHCANGARQIVDIALAGDVIVKDSRSEELAAITPVTAWSGPSDNFMRFISSPAPAPRALKKIVAEQRSRLTEHIVRVGQLSALTRIAHFLMELRARLLRIGEGGRNGFDCPLTQNELADSLGLTPIHLNRMLRDARQRGLFEFRRGRIDFIDFEATARIAEMDNIYI